MIIPAFNCEQRAAFKPTLSLRLVTTKLGTVCEVWSERYDRPAKNGKLFMIDTEGRLVLFKNVNKLFVNVPLSGTILIAQGVG